MAVSNKVITDKLISETGTSDSNLETVILTARDDINLVLKKIFKSHALLTVSLGDDDVCFGSTIIEINQDENYIVIDELYPAEGHAAVEVGIQLTVNAHHAGAFVYFKGTIEAIGDNEKAAYYKIPVPEELEYHQRRNTYRVSTSISDPIPVNLVNEEEVLISAELRDVSVGGVCLRINATPHVEIQSGDYMPTCLIQTENNRKILSSLNICHVERIEKTGSLRVGAEFASISKVDQRELEHLIASLDRAIIKKIKRADTRIAI